MKYELYCTLQTFRLLYSAGFVTFLQNIKYRMARTRYVTYMFVSVWKVAVFFGMMVLLSYFRLENLNSLFKDINPSFANHTLIVNEVRVRMYT